MWIEDAAETDMYHLVTPIYVSGDYDLDIAANVSEAIFYLKSEAYDVIIVDIRIPPGLDPEWRKRYQELEPQNADRLGFELLKELFHKDSIRKDLPPPNQRQERYGVFTIERQNELHPPFLKDLKIKHYQQKTATMPHTALIDFIQDILESLSK